MEYSEWEAIVAYLQNHPLVGLALAVLGVLVLGSLLRKLIKIAMVLAVILLVGLYWTHREAEADWQAQARALGKRAAELGQEALDRGKALLREGTQEIEQRWTEETDE